MTDQWSRHLRYGHLACQHCHRALYASQKNNQIARKRLAASKLRPSTRRPPRYPRTIATKTQMETPQALSTHP
jgi:hypothetical protein